ncbi:PadR family transcriptional regulator [Deinococcus rubellus]|uniref:PadR family transcriptional regulator n=1 Tax=Deinococcus rubellus TaxID=1889240 RepID=A0ABY5YEW2_9DEIO|nr:PadR family transcriptional regulator [Deinococcus rubellus]UWX62706.1 PadR family transcriptional regulator [Deinococcus rubellus]
MPRPPNISPQTQAILAQLAESHPAWAHGYDLSKATDLKSGTLYPILRRLHEAELLDAEWEPSPHAGKPPRHIYRLSEAGLKLARERREETAPILRGALL